MRALTSDIVQLTRALFWGMIKTAFFVISFWGLDGRCHPQPLDWQVISRNHTKNKPGSWRLAVSSALHVSNLQCRVEPACQTSQTAALQQRRQGGFLDTFLQLSPCFIMQLILIILPSVNRLMQQSASSLLYSPPLPTLSSLPPPPPPLFPLLFFSLFLTPSSSSSLPHC